MVRAEQGRLRVLVVYSPRAGEVEETALELAPGASVRDALHESGVLARHAAIDLARHRVGVWGRVRELDAPLRDEDRVEVYRPLLFDPKEARRLRHANQRAA